jgi:hypothetical protein
MNNSKELYNSLVLDSYVQLVKERYPDIFIDELMSYSGMENYEMGDSSVWFTQKQINRFHDKLITLTDNLTIDREAGKFAANSKCSGAVRGMILSLGGIKNAFKLMNKYAKRLNRSSEYKTKITGHNSIEIIVSPYPGIDEEQFQCENRWGNFEGLATLFNHKNIEITHPECIFKGDKTCRYFVSWKKSIFSKLNQVRWFSGFMTMSSFCVQQIGYPIPISKNVVIFLFMIFLFLSWLVQLGKSDKLRKSLNEIYKTNEELLKQIDINAENSRVIMDIGQALRVEQNSSELFDQIAEIAGIRLKYDRVMIMIADADETQLQYRGGFGFTAEEMIYIEKYRISLKNPSTGMFHETFKKKKIVLENDLKSLQKRSTQRSFEPAQFIKPKTIISCPIIVDDKAIGIIVAGNIETPKKLGRNDKHLMIGVAQQIGIIFHIDKISRLQSEKKKPK